MQVKWKKKFNSSFESLQCNGDERNRYIRVDDVWYDAFGEKVKD
ncbi:hypothetical protein [Niabella ginsengisoli]|nr:hypothetical protein [Niabella ginsengisoli]